MINHALAAVLLPRQSAPASQESRATPADEGPSASLKAG